MATSLFDDLIFGPVKSRRLGVSLGVNLLPSNKKVCSFDCIYCECGQNNETKSVRPVMPDRNEVYKSLEAKLSSMMLENTPPDVITFAGNGEPTLHPEFLNIINDTLDLRARLCPKAKVAVLSNATTLHREDVVEALKKVDDNIMKLDGGLDYVIDTLDRPKKSFSLEKLIDKLEAFDGNVVVQTMFVKGMCNGKDADNTFEENVVAWLDILKKIKPRLVMVYTISRDTPIDTLEKIELPKLNEIAKRAEDLGISVQVSG